MKQMATMRQHLIDSLEGRNAHLSFEDAIKEFPEDFYNKKVENIPYSCWDLVCHLQIAQADILDFIVNPEYKSIPWPDGYWPKEAADPGKWNSVVKKYLNDRNTLKDMVRNEETDLFRPIPHASGYTIFREIVLVIDHNSYHTGQIMTLRKALGIWT